MAQPPDVPALQAEFEQALVAARSVADVKAVRDRFLSRKGGPYSHEPADQRNGQFGVLRVTDDGTTLTARLEGHRFDGSSRATQVPGVAVTVRCTGSSCELVT